VRVEDVDDLVAGATVLGSGGGGDWYPPRQMLLHALRRLGPVPLVEPGDLDPALSVLPIISAGTPSAVVELLHAEHESAQLRDLVERLVWPGERCAAVLPIQPGPVHAIVPLVVAAQLGLSCLDADHPGRHPAVTAHRGRLVRHLGGAGGGVGCRRVRDDAQCHAASGAGRPGQHLLGHGRRLRPRGRDRWCEPVPGHRAGAARRWPGL
jgi:hypothetical protein